MLVWVFRTLAKLIACDFTLVFCNLCDTTLKAAKALPNEIVLECHWLATPRPRLSCELQTFDCIPVIEMGEFYVQV